MVEGRKTPEGYKGTEIGIIPEDWDVQSLGTNSILKARIGWQGLTTAEYLTDGEYYLITGTEFINGRIDWDNCYYVEKQRYEQDRNIQVRKNDILVTKDGTIGKVAFIDQLMGRATLNSGIFAIRPLKSAYEPEYLYYILMSRVFRDFLDRLAAGSTISHLYQKDFVHFEFPIPSITEQKAIAEALSDTDNLILSLEKQIDKKKRIKQGAMQQLLTGKKRLPGFTGEWEVKKVADFTVVSSGGTPSTKISEYWNGNIRWMNSGELNLKRVYEVEGRITESGLNNSSTRVIPENSVLIGLAGQGKTRGTASINYVDLCINQSIAAIFPSNLHDSEYLYQNIDSRYDELRSMSTGDGGRGGLNLKIIRNLMVPLPSLNEQKAIAQVLFDMDTEIEALEEKLEKYKTIKQGMMQELLTGRIRLI